MMDHSSSSSPGSALKPELSLEQRQANLERVVATIGEPPVLSAAGAHLMQELMNVDTPVNKLVKIISEDPVLAAKVLRHANSSFYGIRERVLTLRHAIMMLGQVAIKEIASSLFFYSLTRGLAASSTDFYELFLRRSLTMANLSKKIASHYQLQTVGSGEAHLAGLLQNIGVFLLYQFKRKSYKDVLSAVAGGEVELEEAEERIFGCNNRDVGRWAAERWKLPPSLQEIIGVGPERSEEIANAELFSAVQLAGVLCDQMGVTFTGGEPRSSLGALAVKTLQSRLSARGEEAIIQDAMKTFGSVCLASGALVQNLREDAESSSELEAEDSAEGDSVQSRDARPLPPKAVVSADNGVVLSAPQDTKASSESLPFIFEILICGLGQMLRGQVARGLFLFFAFFTLIVIASLSAGRNDTVFLVDVILLVFVWIWNVRDAVTST